MVSLLYYGLVVKIKLNKNIKKQLFKEGSWNNFQILLVLFGSLFLFLGGYCYKESFIFGSIYLSIGCILWLITVVLSHTKKGKIKKYILELEVKE